MAGFVMGMMQVMHPKMGPGNELSAPGLFAKNINPMTPGGLITLFLSMAQLSHLFIRRNSSY
jgi:hypothetical protein